MTATLLTLRALSWATAFRGPDLLPGTTPTQRRWVAKAAKAEFDEIVAANPEAAELASTKEFSKESVTVWSEAPAGISKEKVPAGARMTGPRSTPSGKNQLPQPRGDAPSSNNQDRRPSGSVTS